MSVRSPRIAVACSGLGHIQRGIESWAFDLAQGLRAAGQDVTLFGGAPGTGIRPVRCLRRTDRAAIGLASALRHVGGWRYGAASPYEIEQTSFSLALWPLVRSFDLLHVQDPAIARWFERARRLGLSRPRVIYANGTGEGADVMRGFSYLQLLTQGAADAWAGQRPAGQSVFTIPNFIDTRRFSPGDKLRARRGFGLPESATIILCCAAIRRYHKRIDYLLDEFETFVARGGQDAILVIAGGREDDTDELILAGQHMLGDRVRFLPNLPREQMPDLYRAADMFALTSLQEMFGIVLLEAMASGLPVICNDTADFRSIVGNGGIFRPLADPGALAAGLAAFADVPWRQTLGQAARARVERTFSAQTVIGDIIRMYGSVMAEKHNG